MIISSGAYAHTEDLFPDQSTIVKRIEYADHLERGFKKASVSLFGLELEHILILSPHCYEIKSNLLTGARTFGIVSATCRWYDGQIQIKIPNRSK